MRPEFLQRIYADCEWVRKARAIAWSSFLAYLEMEDMDDEEKKSRLQSLFAVAQTLAKERGLPSPSPPTLQIGNSLYSLSASGDLDMCQCKQPPQVLSAQVVESSRGALSSGAQHPLGYQLVILAVAALAGDQVRLHRENENRATTVNAEVVAPTEAGQAVQLTISVSRDPERVVAVELLRDSFASQPVEVSWPQLPSGNKEQASWKDMSDATNCSNVCSIPAGSKGTGMDDMMHITSDLC